MTASKLNNWRMRWYEAEAVIGCGERCLPLDKLEEALRRVRLADTRWIQVTMAEGTSARVRILTRDRHAGAAAARLGDLLSAAPFGWDWESAVVTAEPKREGIRRWPRLAVLPDQGEQASVDAAWWVGGQVAGVYAEKDPAAKKELRELLAMCGLTVSAGGEAAA